MKKILFACALLLTSLVAGAQTKIAPQMQKGMQKTYVTETITTIAGQKPITMTVETQYSVADATADGYVVDATVTDVQTDADQNDIVGRTLSLTTGTMKGVRTSMSTDKDGKVKKILNFGDIVRSKDQLIDKLLEDIPTTPVLSKEAIREQIAGQITEESILQGMQMGGSPLSLNGKAISTGMQDEYLNQQGLKMKRTFTVQQDGSIQAASTIDMSPAEMKQMIIAQIEKLLPAQADMIKQNIDAVLASGMLKFKMDGKETYTFQADGWVNSITSEADSDTMGQKMTVKTTVRIKQ